MIHAMKLRDLPFSQIEQGSKTVELRLYDEKRRAIRVGDEILFTHCDAPWRTLRCRVLALHVFSTFAELYASLPLLRCGYTEETLSLAHPRDMERYYAPWQERAYGVVGIELSLLERDSD